MTKFKSWYWRHHDEVREKRRIEYQKNKEQIKAKTKAWYYANKDRHRANNKKYRERHPDRTKLATRRSWLRKTYGITLEQYDEFVKKQEGRCKICGEPPTSSKNAWGGRHQRLCVDHNHKTKKVRGLLCNRCNRSLALFNEDPTLFRVAAQYLDPR